MDNEAILSTASVAMGREVFYSQAQALTLTGQRLDQGFDHAVQMLLDANGPVVISGMGKSGIIARKIAATFASTGTSACWVHAGEAHHGDLGIFDAAEVAILISYSGETEEVIRLIPSLKRLGVRIIGMVGDLDSTLATHSDVNLNIAIEREACPNNLAPTTSTTVTAAMGDALAVALIKHRHFEPRDFACFHPGGSLGKRLLTRVSDVMHKSLPICHPNDNIKEVIMTMTHGGLGIAAIEQEGELMGIVTDGDLRRNLFMNAQLDNLTAADMMSPDPLTVQEKEMFADAEAMMLTAKITSLLVVNRQGKLTGVLKLLDAGKVS